METLEPLKTTVVDAAPGAHTHTIILLHGRGSNGAEFASDLLNGTGVLQRLPQYKWIFPTAGLEWNDQFQEEMHSWFDVRSLSDPEFEQETQVLGLRRHVPLLVKLVESEVELLGGQSERLVFGGISQGMATAFWTLVHLAGRFSTIGGFVGLSGWMPFVTQFQQMLDAAGSREANDKSPQSLPLLLASQEARKLTGIPSDLELNRRDLSVFTPIPVFLAHGTDDAEVDVELGRTARKLLSRLSTVVTWREYRGAEQDGHWIKEPEELDDIVQFLNEVS